MQKLKFTIEKYYRSVVIKYLGFQPLVDWITPNKKRGIYYTVKYKCLSIDTPLFFVRFWLPGA